MTNCGSARRLGSLIVRLVATVLSATAAVSDTTPQWPAGVTADWWTEVQRSIQLEQYGVVADGIAEGRYRATNPAQRFKARFDPGGVRLAPLDGEDWEWGLALRAWGRDDALESASAAALESREDRVELGRGLLSEWFVNTPDGLEHGFTVPVRPGGNGEPLVFELALSGGLRPVFAEDLQAIDFHSIGNVAVLRYAKLAVTDAVGYEVPARLEPIAGGFRIVVDDTRAIYPLTVDPLATSAAWSAVGEEAGANFGASVATAGDVNADGYSDVVVGASGADLNRGKAYLYLGGASGLSTVPAWSAVGEALQDYFCHSVGTSGDVNGDGYSDVIVGAYGNAGSQGKAYVYLGGSGGLSTVASWSAVGEAANDRFGFAAATAGDVNGDGNSDVVVGSYLRDGSTGKAYLYLGGASGLSAGASWSAVGEVPGDYFGYTVASAGDVNGDGHADVVVGALGHGGYQGKAYLYLGGPSGLSTSPSWTAVGQEGSDYFSRFVGTAGDVNGDGYADVIAGAEGFGSMQGRAYVYYGGANGLAAGPSWTVTGEAAGDYFGVSLATAGDVNGDGYADVMIGAQGNSVFTGRSYLYLGGAGGLAGSPAWTANGEVSQDRFGRPVAAAGDVNGDGYADVVIGAYNFNSARGKTYLFLGGADTLKAIAAWTATGQATSSSFARAVASAGDVNADGYADVLVGAYSYLSYTGKAYLYLGGSSGPGASPSWTWTGETTGDRVGCAVGSAGDVNGDGYADVVVGAFGASGLAGKAYVFSGGATGLAASPSWVATGEAANDQFGYSAATAGDVDGDGYSDVIVGAIGANSLTGKAYLYRGGARGLSSPASWTALGEAANDRFGWALASAGDVQGDGRSDVIVGSADNGSGRGRAYLYAGVPGGLGASAAWTAIGEAAGNYFGGAVAGAGDVNGDGYSDVAVGAHAASGSLGKTYVYLGGPGGLPATASWMAAGETVSSGFGRSVATAGDVNNDGYSDMLVGASGYNSNSGRAYLFLGSAAGLATSPSWTATGETTNSSLGYALATAGDVNGDGHSDALIGAYQMASLTGKAYVYLGGGGGSVVAPHQLRYDLSGPICLGGPAHEQRFRLGLTLRSPAGRLGRTLQWQVAPWGGVFTPTLNPIRSDPDWYDTAIARSVPVSLSEDHRRYMWRARVRYHPASSPFVPWSPWFTMTGNGLRETDLFSTSDPPPAPCTVPDEEVYITTVTLDLNDKPVLHFQDPNQPSDVTGYHVYRSSAPSGPWTRIASNVVDMDEGTPNHQYVDQNGGGGSTWYYEISAFNGACGAEGPR